MFWQHEAACRDFRLALEQACEQSPHAALTAWLSDRELKAKPRGYESKFRWGDDVPLLRTLVPDAVFALERSNGDSKRYFLEIDRGTQVSPGRFAGKLHHYVRFLDRLGGPVLFVVPDCRRHQQLAQWIQRGAGTQATSFAIARSEDVTVASILHSPIWQAVGDSHKRPLVPTGQTQRSAALASVANDERDAWSS
jgi:hypothetical protein